MEGMARSPRPSRQEALPSKAGMMILSGRSKRATASLCGSPTDISFRDICDMG